MILDSSAILAILFGEPDAPTFAAKMFSATVLRLSAASLTEVSIVSMRTEVDSASVDLARLLRRLKVQVEPLTAEQAALAIEAYRRFGKGFHPARLNLGDCFSYALAMHYREPLLFKGNDFGQTDVLVA